MCDPYQPIERELGLTCQAIQIMHGYGLGVQILTKGAVLARRDFELLGEHDAFAVTLTFDNEADSREWEPGADMPADRLVSLARAKERGIRTWASLEPVVRPEQSLRMIEAAAPYVDLFKVGKWNHAVLAREIDWKDFGNRAVALLERLGKRYLIKVDLKREMER